MSRIQGTLLRRLGEGEVRCEPSTEVERHEPEHEHDAERESGLDEGLTPARPAKSAAEGANHFTMLRRSMATMFCGGMKMSISGVIAL